MARPRTPTNVLNLKGSFDSHADRKRVRENEPQPENIGKAPAYFDAAHKKIWKEIISYMPEGVVGKSDSIALETLTKLIHIMRFDFESLSGVQLERLEALLGRFGMTPADRSKISIPPKKEYSAWDDI